jgi:predicted nucleotidyltransferase
MGTIVPEMGTKLVPGLADALFSPTQQRVLGLLYGQPERTFQSSELIRLADKGTGGVHRFLTRLAEVGLVTVTRVGNQKHYRAARETPIFAELHGLVVKTVGLADPIADALRAAGKSIRAAFVYGSVAKGTDTAGSDVDVLVVSDTLTYPDVHELVAAVEERLGRSVRPTVMSTSEWARQVAKADSFARRLSVGPRLFLVGSADDLA